MNQLPAGYAIRRFRSEDAEALAALALAAIQEIGRRQYSAEQVAAWAARHGGAEMYRERAALGHWLCVAADHCDHPVAYALLEPDGHLDRLYCHPDHTRRGLAEALLEEAEVEARRRSVPRLFTEASELARPAFERSGYVLLHRRDFQIDRVAIHNYAMERRLT